MSGRLTGTRSCSANLFSGRLSVSTALHHHIAPDGEVRKGELTDDECCGKQIAMQMRRDQNRSENGFVTHGVVAARSKAVNIEQEKG